MGQVFYDMGFLSAVEVIECSASDLVAQYVGQTGPKTRRMLEKALGKVLFIDEAYRLGEGHFASEAIDELVDIVTKPKFFGKVVIILAGYKDDMKRLMAVNTGLSSRFSEEIIFRDMSPEHCLQLLDVNLKRKGISVSMLQEHQSAAYKKMRDHFVELSGLPFWGNARDVQTLAKSMIRTAFKAMSGGPKASSLGLTSEEALECAKTMLAERRERCANSQTKGRRPQFGLEDLTEMQDAPPPIRLTTQMAQNIRKAPSPPPELNEPEPEALPKIVDDEQRDTGVSDQIWTQLQTDKQATTLAEKRNQEAMLEVQRELKRAQEEEQAKATHAEAIAQAQARVANDAKWEELKRLREQARLEEQLARRAREEALEKWQRACREEERRRQEEMTAQAKLRKMGVCCAGFRWIKQSSGYRCAGGSHFVSDEQLELAG